MFKIAKAITYMKYVIAQKIWHVRNPHAPWLVPSAVIHLENVLKANHRVFEWGCGRSTVWFQTRVSQVVTVEHNPVWAEKIRPNLDENVTLTLEQNPRLNRAYADYILNQADFDIILVDGRQRLACLLNAHRRLAPGGLIILDNSERFGIPERNHYCFSSQELQKIYENYRSLSFFNGIWVTTFLFR